MRVEKAQCGSGLLRRTALRLNRYDTFWRIDKLWMEA